MANSINATSTGNGGLVTTGDDSGILNIQTNETTAISIDASQNLTFTNGVNAPNTFGFKNRLINGNFDIWQRGTTGTGAVYVADRWTTDQVNTTQARSTDVPSSIGATYSLQVSGSSGTCATVQKVESNNCKDMAGQKASVSFYAKSASGTPTLTFDVRYATALDNFASMTIMQSTSVTLSTTWTKYTFTFDALNANVVNGLALFFYNTSTQTFLLSQVQIEKGTQATSFDFRSYGTELALCQRYYQAYYGSSGLNLFARSYAASAGQSFPVSIPVKVSFRAAPTGTIVGTWVATNALQPSVVSTNTECVGVIFNSVASGDCFVYPNSTSIGVTFSAEL